MSRITESNTRMKGEDLIGEKEAWQLRLFRKTLKKQQKLSSLLDVLGSTSGLKCLLITCGDNNGALNWHFKEWGGTWTWADFEKDSVDQINELTGDPVDSLHKDNTTLPYHDESFDLVLTIDVHEHLEEPNMLNGEIERVVKSGGRVIITTPNGNISKLANRIKRILGMNPEAYGHVVAGYDVPDLTDQLETVGLKLIGNSSYSRFFTEMMELVINFTYVKILSRRSKVKVEKGQIAPQNSGQLNSVGKSYKLYERIYPLLSVVSKLDILDRSPRGYAVIVEARKN